MPEPAPLDAAAHFARLPKVELHVHLEGAVTATSLWEMAVRNSVQLPVSSPQEFDAWLRSIDRSRFFGAFTLACSCFCSSEDFELATYSYCAEMSRQNIRYAEVTVSIPFHKRRGVDFDTCFRGMHRGRELGRHDFGVDVAWIVPMNRAPTLDPARRGELADYAVSAAIDGQSEGVVAIGLGGEETEHDVNQFSRPVERALASGLRFVPHAGELAGPDNVADALDLGATRIAHGIRAAEDPVLVTRLVTAGIALDICPSSNLVLGVCDSLTSHPLRALKAAGVPVTINTDDPLFFGADLNGELRTAAESMGLGVAGVQDTIAAAVDHSFLAPDKRERLRSMMEVEMLAIRPRPGSDSHVGSPPELP